MLLVSLFIHLYISLSTLHFLHYPSICCNFPGGEATIMIIVTPYFISRHFVVHSFPLRTSLSVRSLPKLTPSLLHVIALPKASTTRFGLDIQDVARTISLAWGWAKVRLPYFSYFTSSHSSSVFLPFRSPYLCLPPSHMRFFHHLPLPLLRPLTQ